MECRAELEIFRTRDMIQLVVDFYAHIFVFLSDVMDWVTEKRRKRLLDSFNENLFQKFEDQIDKIKVKSEMIRNLAAQSSRAEQRVTRLILEDLGKDVRLGLQGEERRHAEMVCFAERMEKELSEKRRTGQQLRVDDQAFEQLANRLTHSVFSMLQDKALGWIGDIRSANNGRLQRLYLKWPVKLTTGILNLLILGMLPVSHLQVLASQRPGSSNSNRTTSAAVLEWTSHDVLMNSRHLEDFFHRDRVRLPLEPSSPTRVSPETVKRLSEWMKATSSQFLWLEGPFLVGDELENPLAMLSNKVIDLADQSRIPIIS